MLLSSEEVVIKKPKSQSANIDEDFISKLPDILLIHILSFLPAPDAYRTCILSKRWINICNFSPDLRLIMPDRWSIEEVNMFYDSLDQTLALRGGLPFRRFSLSCSRNNLYNHVYDVLCKVGKYQELHLMFPADKRTVTFYQDLIETCRSLVSLRLSNVFVSHVPDAELLFPFLKKMVLEIVYYSDDKSISKLISGCPILQELTVENHSIDYTDTFKISSPSLKRLSLSYIFGDVKIAIDAPKLEYVNIWSVHATSISMTKPLSLIEAHIKTLTEVCLDVQFLKCFSSVKILTLAGLHSWVHDHNDVNVLNFPVFPSLVKFELGTNIPLGRNRFLMLLDRMPNLEDLTFAIGHRFPWCLQHTGEEELVPACLRFKMKKIVIRNRQPMMQVEFGLIKYMLKYSNNLETMMINTHYIDATAHKRLLNFYRGSKSCRIQFI